MYFYLLGIDYKSAPIGAREALYRKRKDLDRFLAAPLYTCNRIELYGLAQDLFEARILINIFRREFNEFADYGYIRLGKKDVFRHLLRVASGLESQIKGEPQILQQLYTWRVKNYFPEPLLGLISKAVSSAKDIRIKSGLGRVDNNIATFVSGNLLERIKEQKRLKVVIVGTGKIAELFALSPHPRLYLYFAAHKNYLKARELAKRAGGEALELKNLPERLSAIDALISATSSPHFLFDENYLRKAGAKREKPLYLYDLAIPRDINPNAANVEGILLNDLDTLTEIIDAQNKNQQTFIFLAEGMIEEVMQGYEEQAYEDDFKAGYACQPVSLKTS